MKSTLIERMQKRNAPVVWTTEVDAMLNHIDDLDERNEEHLKIIDTLARQRDELKKILGNTATAIESTWNDTGYNSGGIASIVTQIDDLLVAIDNEQGIF